MAYRVRHGGLSSLLWRDRRGGVALEFAVVSLPFLAMLVFLMELGFDFYAQVCLDYGVQVAARQIQIGTAQDANTAAIFQAKYMCPALNGLLSCSSVTINVVPINSDYYAAVPATYTYCPGKPDQLMLVQASYTSPSLIAAIVPAMATATAGGFVHVTMSSAAFINEKFSVTSAPPAGC